MKFQFKIINTKKLKFALLVSVIFWLIVSILIVWLKVKIYVFGFTFILAPILAFVASIRYSLFKVDITLNSEQLILNDFALELKDICGYYIDDQSILLRELEIKDIKNKDYKIISLLMGANGKIFEDFLVQFTKNISTHNPNINKMTFFEFHKTQFKVQKFLLPFDIIFVVMVNLTFMYLLITGKMEFSWKILFVDLMFLSMLSFYRRNKLIDKK